MVFHEVESIVDVINGHRIIIYYIEGDTTNKLNLRSSVEYIMEMLEKKNDDIIIFKVCQNTSHFNQFKELYKPEISGPIALFVINGDGIPLICEQIHSEDEIYQAFDSVCRHCKINSVLESEITKVINGEFVKTYPNRNFKGNLMNELQPRSLPPNQGSKMSLCQTEKPVPDLSSDSTNDNICLQSVSTELQIRLPDGTKEKQRFETSVLLQNVYDFIRNKFNLSDFHLKTYNRNIFSAEDYERTLQDLDLTPNGVVIVVYKNVMPFNGSGSISKKMQYVFWILFANVTSVFHYVQGLLSAFWNSFFSSGTRPSREIQNQAQGSTTDRNKRDYNGIKKSTSRFGNIHTLKRNEDSDDENNRYNGNSTQQK